MRFFGCPLARSIAVATLAILLVTCGTSRVPGDVKTRKSGLEGCADWEGSERLSSTQKAVLATLHASYGICALHVGPQSEASVIVHNGHGYSIDKLGPSTSLMARMHSWQAMGHRVSLMTAWNLQEADGADCVALVNGSLPAGSSPRVSGTH